MLGRSSALGVRQQREAHISPGLGSVEPTYLLPNTRNKFYTHWNDDVLREIGA